MIFGLIDRWESSKTFLFAWIIQFSFFLFESDCPLTNLQSMLNAMANSEHQTWLTEVLALPIEQAHEDYSNNTLLDSHPLPTTIFYDAALS